MIESPPGFGPYRFVLTKEEVEVAASRIGLRTALAGGLTARHLAPLAIFVLAVAFAAILALVGFISRRHGEEILVAAAAAYMIQRATTRWRLRRERTAGQRAMAVAADGPVEARVGQSALELTRSGTLLRWPFDECVDAEDAGEMIYLWPRSGTPACIPSRALASGEEAARLLAFLRGRIAIR